MRNINDLVSLMLGAIDEDVCEAFCTGCEAREFTPATFTDPYEEWCPAYFSPGDPGCAKYEIYKQMEEKAGEVISLLGEAQEENVYLSCVRED